MEAFYLTCKNLNITLARAWNAPARQKFDVVATYFTVELFYVKTKILMKGLVDRGNVS
jgi:hypothetical protein